MPDRLAADEAALADIGHALADGLRAPAVVWLQGPLGAGKTTLARAVLRRFGHTGAVRSPTYTLVETYDFAGFRVHHLDLYRLVDPEELELIGVRDLATDDAIWLVEWAERGGDRLPRPDRVIDIAFADHGRRISGLPETLTLGGNT